MLTDDVKPGGLQGIEYCYCKYVISIQNDSFSRINWRRIKNYSFPMYSMKTVWHWLPTHWCIVEHSWSFDHVKSNIITAVKPACVLWTMFMDCTVAFSLTPQKHYYLKKVGIISFSEKYFYLLFEYVLGTRIKHLPRFLNILFIYLFVNICVLGHHNSIGKWYKNSHFSIIHLDGVIFNNSLYIFFLLNLHFHFSVNVNPLQIKLIQINIYKFIQARCITQIQHL